MKTIQTFLVAFVLMMTATTAHAQVRFGLKGGVNLTNFSFNNGLDNVLDASNRTGFYIGPTLFVKVPLVGLGVDGSVLYDQREAKIKGTDETLKQQQVAIPINLRYSFGLGGTASVFLFAGPQFGFNVGGKNIKELVEEAGWKFKDSQFSVNVGAGIFVLDHLQINANYNIACGATGEVTDVTNIGNTVSKAFNGKANAWQIGLAYYF